MNPRNKFLDAAMNKVATAAVQQVCDLAFYKRRDALGRQPPRRQPGRGQARTA